jgi:hypothetical protein
MPNEDYTHLAIAVDRSGSMTSIAAAMKEGFDEFINGQRDVDGKATLTLARFDDQYELVYDMIDLPDVGPLELNPRGMTALLDGMGMTLESVRSNIEGMPDDEKPAKCLFVFITDGGENSSKEYDREGVFNMIQDCQNDEKVNYEFIFLGANQDAIAEGGNFGIRGDASMTYAATAEGSINAYRSLSKSVTGYRTSSVGEATIAFSDQDRLDATGNIDLLGVQK